FRLSLMFTSYPFFDVISLGFSQRRKTPLLASSSTQNSALISKSAYEVFVTRNPLPVFACTTPSTNCQLASPIASNADRSLPSQSVTHPPAAFSCAAACRVASNGVKPTSRRTIVTAVVRPIAQLL